PKGATAITGRVVDANGAGVAGATVVAWQGNLLGDARRAYVHPRFDGDVATTAPDRSFPIRPAPGSGIIAGKHHRRTRPREIPATDPLSLALEPTRTASGRVGGDELAAVIVIADYKLGHDAQWREATAIDASHDYHLVGLPAGDATFTLLSLANTGHARR